MKATTAAIDPGLDFASHYRTGGDPDRDCQRLYAWHRTLWGRGAAGVGPFELEVTYSRGYGLRLLADGAEFWLGSDSMIPTWSAPGWTAKFAPDLAAEIAKDFHDFYRVSSTIGGYIVFPRNRAGQTGWTINQCRGMYSSIADRFDLTLECIRRHYSDPGATNPLGKRLAYYNDFFELFGDFDTYVSFFLLDDFVDESRKAVRSLITGDPLTKFNVPAYAGSLTQYREYRQRSITAVNARNERIQQLSLETGAFECVTCSSNMH